MSRTTQGELGKISLTGKVFFLMRDMNDGCHVLSSFELEYKICNNILLYITYILLGENATIR